jgi:hypothetical protein
MSRHTKRVLGPLKTVDCESCGVKLSISWACMWLTSPAIAAWVVLMLPIVGHTNAAYVIAAVTIPVSFFLMFRYWSRVPLVERRPAGRR